MNRKDAIAAIRVAAYHNDMMLVTRIYSESRISYAAMKDAISAGQMAKNKGIPCGCMFCKEAMK